MAFFPSPRRKHLSLLGSILLAAAVLPLRSAEAALCWDIRVKRHVECGSTPRELRRRSTPRPTQPTGPSQEELRRKRDKEEARREEEEERKREEEERRQEEKRWAQEEADRERRRREKEARERRGILKKKGEALRALKRPDFDGSGGALGLKPLMPRSGTSTFGIKPNPGGGLKLKPLRPSPSRNLWRGPLFSRGSKFSAPVDAQRKDPRRPFVVDSRKTGNLIPGGDVGRFVSKKSWPASAKAETIAGFLAWERGRYGQAVMFLGRALAQAPNDKFLRRALAKAKRAQRRAQRKAPARENQAEASASMVAAAGRWRVGDTATALRMVERAARLWPENPDTQKSLRRVRRMHAARKDLPKPADAAARHERAATWARGQAAFKMGLIFAAQADLTNDKGRRYWATIYLAEASFSLRGRDRQLIDALRGKLQRGEPLHDPGSISGNRRGFYPTKAAAMLDALEYGKGDWKKTFRYLDHARLMFPRDRTIAAAKKELSIIHRRGGMQNTRR